LPVKRVEASGLRDVTPESGRIRQELTRLP
jgi:hypothetical protein